MPGAINPIQEVQIGAVAYAFGITNNGTPIALTGVVSFELDSDELTRTWTEKENKDTTGNVQNFTQVNFRRDRQVKFKPSGTSRANANAVVGQVLTLLVLTVANYAIPAFNGSYRIKPGLKISLKMEENVEIDIPCEQYENAAQNAQLTGAPIVG